MWEQEIVIIYMREKYYETAVWVKKRAHFQNIIFQFYINMYTLPMSPANFWLKKPKFIPVSNLNLCYWEVRDILCCDKSSKGGIFISFQYWNHVNLFQK